MIHYVYQITNLINGKIYVGKHSTNDLNDGYMGSGKLLNLAINKHGVENFRKHIIKMCETSEEAFEFERHVVNEQFVTNKNTYNLTMGGSSNWFHINSDIAFRKEKNRRAAITMNSKTWADEDFRKRTSERMKNLHFEGQLSAPKCDWTGRRHNDLTKAKIGKANSVHQSGTSNSQYGTVWVSNYDLKKSVRIKCEELSHYLDLGWSKGRKMNW